MKTPGFTANASVYRTSGHYRGRGHTISLPSQSAGAIKAAAMAEEIEVFGCRPGFLQLGEGPNMVCINPSDPFGTGGHDGGGPGAGGDGGGGGGGGNGGPKSRPKGQDPKYANKKCSCNGCAKGGGDVYGKCASVCKDKEVFTGGEGLYCTKSGEKEPPIIPPVHGRRVAAFGF